MLKDAQRRGLALRQGEPTYYLVVNYQRADIGTPMSPPSWKFTLRYLLVISSTY